MLLSLNLFVIFKALWGQFCKGLTMSTIEKSEDSASQSSSYSSSAVGSGKLILFGEHAVVYGYSAVALALPCGLEVIIEENLETASGFTLATEGRFAQVPTQESSVLIQAFSQGFAWARKQGLSLEAHYSLRIEGALPFKVGLGSSAALSVATLKALAKLKGQNWSKTELFEGAMAMEKVFHHQPSGLDHRVSIEGGVQAFQRINGQIELEEVMNALPLHLLLTWGPREGTTADAVAQVAQDRAHKPQVYKALFEQIETNTQLGREALKNGNLEQLGVSFDVNHQLLRDLGVVTPALDKACSDLKDLGALGAKMSGAGRGGTSFGLFKTQAEAIRAAQILEKQGCQVWQVNI